MIAAIAARILIDKRFIVKVKHTLIFISMVSFAEYSLKLEWFGNSELRAGCLGCVSSSDEERFRVYQTLKSWWEKHPESEVQLPGYRQSRKLMSKLKKNKPLNRSEKGGLWLRRLVKQNKGLTNEITLEILSDPRLSAHAFKNLPEFISVFGILASTRIGFTTYYPELNWPVEE